MKSFNTGLFIDAVRCQPCLYKQSHPDYKDSSKKISIWNDIAQQFHILSGEAAKGKWRNVRDSYVKHLRSLKMGNSKKKYNSWPWSDKMEFLIPYVTGKQLLSDNLLDADHQEFAKRKNVWDDGDRLRLPLYSESTHLEDHQRVSEKSMKPHPEDSIHSESMHPEHHRRADESLMIPHPQDSTHSESVRPEDHQLVDENLMATTLCTPDFVEPINIEVSDPTDLMMLSHARRIRGFSRKRQIQIEMKISQLVMEAEMEQLAESESPASSQQVASYMTTD